MLECTVSLFQAVRNMPAIALIIMDFSRALA